MELDSDSDTDGSHISATPPSSPSPAASVSRPPISGGATVISLNRPATKKSAPTSTTTRMLLKPKILKKKTNPPPELVPSPSKPVDAAPIFANLPFQIKKLSDIEEGKCAHDGLLLGGHCVSRFASFVGSNGKNIDFQPENAEEKRSEVSDASAVLGQVSEGKAVDKGSTSKKVANFTNLIGGNDSRSVAKRVKHANEGNFVKLNINGYGRKRFSFKNKRQGFSKRRKWSRNFRSSAAETEESHNIGEESLVVDTEKLPYDAELLEEAVTKVRDEASDENLLKLLNVVYGYDSFREGQLEAIKMVLSMKSTMLVLPTGAGKSLCYQLPALVLPGITLVVSPLVALMVDQLKKLPIGIRGGLLSSNQTVEEASETLRLLQLGEIKVLFVSPERFLSAEFLPSLKSQHISLVVVDEAHCVSEWSHNFRPSYMRLRASLLRGQLNAGCILAMTATATRRTLENIMNVLEIPPSNLIQTAKLRDNFHLSVCKSDNRMKDLMALLKASPFPEIDCIIIYCKFQSDTETISKHLCDNNILAKCYHSGLPAKDRMRTLDLFCANKIRVVVATVAFGMGLDKRDVGAVVHYSIPESLEEYVQEIGRAGRNGRTAFCHLLLDNATYIKLRSLMHSDGVDEYAVNKLLSQIFTGCRVPTSETCSIIKEPASLKFDMREEVILTILTQLELGETKYIQMLPEMNVTCSMNFHQTSPSILAAKDPVVAEILRKSEIKDGHYVCHLPTLANNIKMPLPVLMNNLQSLKFKGEITYQLKDPAFCYLILEVPKDICSLASTLTKWLEEVETCKVQKLDVMYTTAANASQNGEQTACLQRKILEYFSQDGNGEALSPADQHSPFLQADIKVFLQSNAHVKFTPRAVARILHGLGSPAFPSATWSRTHFWGRYVQTDFRTIMEAAKAGLMSSVGNLVS